MILLICEGDAHTTQFVTPAPCFSTLSLSRITYFSKRCIRLHTMALPMPALASERKCIVSRDRSFRAAGLLSIFGAALASQARRSLSSLSIL